MVWVWSVTVVHVVPVWIGGERRRKKVFVSYGNTMRQTQALINYMVHLHIPGVRHYVNTEQFA